jgi:large subunit ribosomal protein L9
MKVILREDLPHLGETGDVVEVKPGYARNYLIPNKLAMEANEGNLKTFKDIARAKEARSEKERADSESLADRLTGVEIRIEVEVGEEDQLYGSVTSQMIVDALAEQGFDFPRRQILLDTPIKELGTFDIPVRLHREIQPTVKLHVEKAISEEEPEIVEED